ncbi:MAG: hypothetical protein PHC54_01520 [Candidatus Omnitrophica bacterium]|nr:hypothetical protein [Candidatus Omnitrophota bacterium]MDD5591741.1 hypothetical protein [Candidatus Omnitrophota bacterium]
MLSDKAFKIAFLLSLAAHGVILFQNPNLNPHLSSADKKKQNLEVSYIEPALKKQAHQEIPQPKQDFLKSSPKATAMKAAPPPFIDREVIFKKDRQALSQKYTFTKPAFIKPDIIAVKKKITLPPIDINKINSPSYITYYQMVREKIRRSAYQNYSRVEVGEVYLSFVILSDGSLKETRLLQEKSSPIPYLREIALRSVKESSPFANFPKELDYPQLSFNVIISFEVE